MAVAFDNVTMDEAVAQAVENLQSKRRCMVVTPNAEIAQSCVTDDRLREIVRKAGLVLPDGIGVIYASRILKKPLKQRVPGVAEEAAHRLQVKYPGLKVAGTKDGYFQREEEAVEAVQQAKPDVLFVCLGSPKQEYFMADHFDQLGATLMVGLGGSLDVYAGKVERAPALFRKLGLEWFYRLLRQPSRLGRMMKLPQYLWQSIRWRMKGEK